MDQQVNIVAMVLKDSVHLVKDDTIPKVAERVKRWKVLLLGNRKIKGDQRANVEVELLPVFMRGRVSSQELHTRTSDEVENVCFALARIEKVMKDEMGQR